MNNKTTRKWVAILATALALSLLLAACGGNSPSDEPTGTTEPPVSQTASGTPNTTPDDTDTPDNTPGETEPSASGTSDTPTEIETPKYNMPPYDEAAKTDLEERIAEIETWMLLLNGRQDFNIENILEDIYVKYGNYLNVNISKDSIKLGILTGASSSYYEAKGVNLTGISPDALKKVSDFLAEKGENELDSEIPEQNIAALWLAASLYYDPDYVHENDMYKDDPCNDIAMAFGLTRANSSTGDIGFLRDSYWSVYVSLYGGPFVIADYQ